jgi:hypothetical protein
MPDAEQQLELPPKRITVNLSADEHLILRLIAFAQDVPVAAMVRECIRAYIAHEDSMGSLDELIIPASQRQAVDEARGRLMKAYKTTKIGDDL